MTILFRFLLAICLLSLLSLVSQASATCTLESPGVNLSGGEYGGISSNNVINKNYVYPTTSEIDYFSNLGIKAFRVPFLMERIEPSQNGPLNLSELSHIDNLVAEAAKDKSFIILDAHNFGHAWGNDIGSTATPTSSLATFWSLVATHYKNYSNVVIDIMNEPHDQTPQSWAVIAQSTITAIRKTGFKNWIFVSGSDWDGGMSWVTSGNAAALVNIKDPLNDIVFEVHQYLNPGNTGQNCKVTTVGSTDLEAVTNWAIKNNKKLWLGEIGVCSDPTSLSAFSATLNYLNENYKEWQGLTYWTGGPWMGSYIYTVNPSSSGVESVQLKSLLQAIP